MQQSAGIARCRTINFLCSQLGKNKKTFVVIPSSDWGLHVSHLLLHLILSRILWYRNFYHLQIGDDSIVANQAESNAKPPAPRVPDTSSAMAPRIPTVNSHTKDELAIPNCKTYEKANHHKNAWQDTGRTDGSGCLWRVVSGRIKWSQAVAFHLMHKVKQVEFVKMS